MLREKVLPFLGDMRICGISNADVIRWHNELRAIATGKDKPLSGTYLRSIDSQLSAVLNHAVKHYGLQRNPIADVGCVGRKEAEEMLFWTREEYLAFADAVADKPVSHLAFEILYWCGLREGELLSLTAGDVDFGRGSVAATKSLAKSAEGWAAVPPKLKKSARRVSVPQFLLDEEVTVVPSNRVIRALKDHCLLVIRELQAVDLASNGNLQATRTALADLDRLIAILEGFSGESVTQEDPIRALERSR